MNIKPNRCNSTLNNPTLWLLHSQTLLTLLKNKHTLQNKPLCHTITLIQGKQHSLKPFTQVNVETHIQIK